MEWQLPKQDILQQPIVVNHRSLKVAVLQQVPMLQLPALPQT